MIFDGRAFAEEIISKLPHTCLPAGRSPKLAIFLDPSNISGAKYVERKVAVAKILGVEVEVTMTNSQIPLKTQITNIKSQIEKLNKDETVTGIMIQLPLGFGHWDLDIASAIKREKDVDGLREDSPFLPAAVRAVKEIISNQSSVISNQSKVCVVGAKGFIGRKLIKVLGVRPARNASSIADAGGYSVFGMDKEDFDPEKIKEFDIVISATGQEGLIKDVKQGAVCIDLGFPRGDFDPKIAEKASFFTPVPGGVGPVTVACLFANLLGE